MSKIDIVGKWDLNNNNWYDPYTEKKEAAPWLLLV